MKGRWLGCLAAGLLTLAAVLVAYRFAPGVVVGPSRADALVFRNFHSPLLTPTATRRWSHGAGARRVRDQQPSVIVLPQLGRVSASLLELDLFTPWKPGPTPVTISVNGRLLATAQVQGAQRLPLRLDSETLGAGDLTVVLSGPAWNPPQEPARLGVGIERVAWSPQDVVAAPRRQLWILPGVACLLALLLIRLGLAPAAAALLAGAGGVVLAVAAALRPLLVAPFSHRLLLVLVLTHVALVLWSALVARRGWLRLPERIGAAEALLLMGVGYWMLLLFQRALYFETARGAPPHRGTEIVGLLVLVALAALAARGAAQAAALWVLGIGAAAQGVVQAAFALRRPAVDFVILWRAVHDHALGRELYKLETIRDTPFGDIFKVPPFYGMVLLPLAQLSRSRALLVHRLIDCCLYLLVAFLLVRLLCSRLGTGLALALVALVMGSMRLPFDTIAYGQIDVVLLLMMTIALVGLGSERLWLAGLGIAAGALFKVYPLMLAGIFIGRRQWKGLAWTGLWLVVLNAISIVPMGWRNLVIYATEVFPRIGGGTSWVENQAVHGFMSRLATGHLASIPTENALVNGLTYLAFALVTGLFILRAARRAEPGSSLEAVQFGSFILAMVLVGPNAWMHYETIMALTFVALVWHAADRPFTLRQAFLLGAGFALVAYGNQWSFFDGGRSPGLPALALSYKFYGLVGLFVLISGLLAVPQAAAVSALEERSA